MAPFIKSWKVFINPKNIAGLTLIIALTAFKFFIQHFNFEASVYIPATGEFMTILLPFGDLMAIAAWGGLFWYYMEFIYSTAFGADTLPEAYMGGFSGFLANILKSIYTFIAAAFMVGLPMVIVFFIQQNIQTDLTWLLWTLGLAGLFAFPVTVLNVAVGRDLTMLFRYDFIVKPIIKIFKPYLVVAALVILAFFLQYKTAFYGRVMDRGTLIIAAHMVANFAVQAIIIIAMRSIGLFFRHYGCYLPW